MSLHQLLHSINRYSAKILCGIICITLFIFYRAYRVSQVSPYDDNPETIEKKIQQRQEELFAESMATIRNNEREYEEKMTLDRLERKKRKQERRHREEVLRYLENHLRSQSIRRKVMRIFN